MAAFSGIPNWVQVSKQKVQKSEEWLSFSKALFDLVTVHMTETGVRSFGLLSPDEKKVLVLKGIETLKDDDVYKALFASVSTALDNELSVAISAAGNDKQHRVSKSDLLSKECHNALESILNKWPDSKSHFIQCLNVPLSAELRYTIWKTQLQEPLVKKEYLKVAELSPRRLVSRSDLEISQKCQTLIHSDESLRELREIRASSSVLRHLLSYHHVISTSPEPLTDTEYLLAVPFVYCTLAPLIKAKRSARSSTLTTDSMATMVEQFELFWAQRPDYTKSVEGSLSMQSFCNKLLVILNKIDPSLEANLGDLYSKMYHTVENSAQNALADLFQPILRSYFVGYLPLETVMFICDQIIIGYDAEHYDAIPYVCVSILMTQGRQLESCSSWREVKSSFNNKIKTLKPGQIKRMLSEFNFNNELTQLLEKERSKHLHFPVSSAAVLNQLPPWRRWYSDKLASHFKSTRKGSSVNVSSVPDIGALEIGNHEKEDHGEQSETELLLERDNLIHEVHQMREELEDARKLIRNEQQKELSYKEQAEEEIDRLTKKVLFLERQAVPDPVSILPASLFGLTEPKYEESDTSSVTSVVAPPPSMLSAPKTPVPQSRVQSAESVPSIRGVEEVDAVAEAQTPPKDVMKLVMRDLTAKLMGGINLIAHGSGAEREALNAQTKADLESVREAYVLAKLQVFGKPISDEEIQQLPQAQQQAASLKLSEATKRQLLKLKPAK